mmetsp:Transcript_54807/g.174130  ORF Transcript_54807/g.174130 Transcript_54807/m.174130 type:complete len:266 (+) Transcript_54807:336-1133(+)
MSLLLDILHGHAITIAAGLRILVRHVRGPEGEVVAKELHDERAVLVALLPKRVKLRDGLIERLLRQPASALWRVEDLVIEHGEVEGEAEADGVSGGELAVGDVLGGLVGEEGGLGLLLAVRVGLELGQVAVVVALHLEVEHLGLARGGVRHEGRVQEGEDAGADLGELGLNLCAVLLDKLDVLVVALGLLLLLDGGDDAPGRAAGADHVLVGDGEEVALLDVELLVAGHLGHGLHVLLHLVVALGLLGELGHVHMLFAGRVSHLD